jgi:hypothetical protein
MPDGLPAKSGDLLRLQTQGGLTGRIQVHHAALPVCHGGWINMPVFDNLDFRWP